MKHSINWHEECLQNRFSSLSKRELELKAMQERVERDTRQYLFYARQIHQARIRGMDSFDSERFLLKEKPEG